MINFYQIISPFYHHYNWFYTIMIIDDHPKMAILHHRIPTRHPGHPGGIRPPPHRRTSPRPWRWRPRRSSHARRSGTIAPGHLALRRDPERPRITRILRFVMNCYVLLTCYKKLLSPSPVGFCWPEFLFLKKTGWSLGIVGQKILEIPALTIGCDGAWETRWGLKLWWSSWVLSFVTSSKFKMESNTVLK